MTDGRSTNWARRRLRWAPRALLLLVAVAATLPGAATAEQASQPASPAAGYLTTSHHHSCAVNAFAVRCWGYGGDGQLGYGNKKSIGDDDEPGSVGPIDFGAGLNVIAISAGNVHTCALLSDGTVRCWGFGANGRLGYGSTESIGDDEPVDATLGAVNLGPGRTAKAISAGDGHTCAILDDDTVRCWGYGFDGRLGYNSTESVGDDETPGERGPVNFGAGRTAKAISAGNAHTCAILDDDTVRCWGFGGAGRLGYGNVQDVGRGCVLVNNICTPTPETPRVDTVGPVKLGPGRTAKAISAGQFHTCAVLDDDTVRCWGTGGSGRLGYQSVDTVGDDETPDARGPVDLGAGRTAKAVSAGGEHTCVVLDDNNVSCWGAGAFGQLGYASSDSVGDDEAPGTAGTVDLGTGRTATAVSAGLYHTCARLDDESVRCWGYGANGRLGYCDERTIGDNESPGTAGPVALGQPGIAGDGCPATPRPPVGPRPPAAGGSSPPPPAPDSLAAALAAQRERAAAMGSCMRRVKRKVNAERRRLRGLSASRRRSVRSQIRRRAARKRKACVRRYGREPGRVTSFSARASGARKIRLSFRAVGTDGSEQPAARSYLIKQSRRPIRTARQFRRAPALCKGKCSFKITRVGASLGLTVTDLRRRGRYYFAIAARDNVSGRIGPRSRTVRARAR